MRFYSYFHILFQTGIIQNHNKTGTQRLGFISYRFCEPELAGNPQLGQSRVAPGTPGPAFSLPQGATRTEVKGPQEEGVGLGSLIGF